MMVCTWSAKSKSRSSGPLMIMTRCNYLASDLKSTYQELSQHQRSTAKCQKGQFCDMSYISTYRLDLADQIDHNWGQLRPSNHRARNESQYCQVIISSGFVSCPPLSSHDPKCVPHYCHLIPNMSPIILNWSQIIQVCVHWLSWLSVWRWARQCKHSPTCFQRSEQWAHFIISLYILICDGDDGDHGEDVRDGNQAANDDNDVQCPKTLAIILQDSTYFKQISNPICQF